MPQDLPHRAAKREYLGDSPLTEIGQLQGVHEELYLVSANRKIKNSIAAQIMNTFSV